MTENDIVMEIKTFVDGYMDKGEAVIVDHVVQSILDAHPIEGEVAE
jgi:hypothetical protein